MFGEYLYDEGASRSQVWSMYKNTLYRLEREKAVLLCMIKQYLNNGVRNFGEIPNLITQNKKVDDIIVLEMQFRELLGSIEKNTI